MNRSNRALGMPLRLAAVLAVATVVVGCANQSFPTPSAGPSQSVLAATAAPTGTFNSFGPTGLSARMPTSGTVTIVAAGDIACDPNANTTAPADCDQAATAALIGQLNPTAVLTLGDNQYEDGTLADFQAVFAPSWGKYRSIMFPSIGNHEYISSNTAAGYFDYFGVPSYYSFNLGTWHLIALNSECHFIGGCHQGSPEETWLKADLAAHSGQCTLVYWHEPAWSSGEHHDATQMDTIWKDLVAAHVTVVLAGHNHDYERFVPLNGSGLPDPSGVAEFVVGTGGKNHYGFVDPSLPGEVVRNDQSFGVISMTLAPGSYSWRFVPAATYTFTDSGTARCAS